MDSLCILVLLVVAIPWPIDHMRVLQVVEYIETKWRSFSPPSVNKIAVRATLRVDTQAAKSAPTSRNDDHYLALSPCPEITRFVFDEVMNELHNGAEHPDAPAVPPGA